MRPHVPFVAPKSYFDAYPHEQMVLHPKVKNDWADIPAAGINYVTSVNAKMYEEQQKKAIAGYYASVAYMDAQVGKELKTLKEEGLEDNTIVIFTSDNGSMWLEEDIASTGHYTNGIWSGKKSDIWEGGHRMPFLATWPAKITPQRISNQLISSTDLYATLAEIVNETTSDNAAEDSYSFWQTLNEGKEYQENNPRQSMVYHSVEGYFGLRKGDWVLLDCKGSGGWTLPEKEALDLPNIQLYNLKIG